MPYISKFDQVFEDLWKVYHGSMRKYDLKEEIRIASSVRGEKACDIAMDIYHTLTGDAYDSKPVYNRKKPVRV